MGQAVSNFLLGLLMPIFWTLIYWASVGKIFSSRAERKRQTIHVWRIQNAITLIAGIIAIGGGGRDVIKGAAVSMALCMLFDDNIRKKGRRAAKLIGDKSRQILESMRERMTPEPLPGLSAVR